MLANSLNAKLAALTLQVSLIASCSSTPFGGGQNVQTPEKKTDTTPTTQTQQPVAQAPQPQTQTSVPVAQQPAPQTPVVVPAPVVPVVQQPVTPIASQPTAPNPTFSQPAPQATAAPIPSTVSTLPPIANMPPMTPSTPDVGSLRVDAMMYFNMENNRHATDPGVWALLKDSGGNVVAAGPMNLESACKGENKNTMSAPIVNLNIGLKFVRGSTTEQQLQPTQQKMQLASNAASTNGSTGTFSICKVANPGAAMDQLACDPKDNEKSIDNRPARWINRSVNWTAASNGSISISNMRGAKDLSFAHPVQAGICAGDITGQDDFNSPLVLDLNGNDQMDLVSVWKSKHPVRFDIRANGQKVRTGWVKSSDGILALDVDGSGKIESGLELFGEDSASLIPVDSWALRNFNNGFSALSQYDSNQDGVIDEKDPIFKRLLVWQDKNQDGVSQKAELTALKGLKIKSISLAYKQSNSSTNFQMVEHNELRQISSFAYENGKSGKIVDVWFSARLDESELVINSPARKK